MIVWKGRGMVLNIAKEGRMVIRNTVLFCQIRHKTGSLAFEENCTNLEPNSEYGINSHI